MKADLEKLYKEFIEELRGRSKEEICEFLIKYRESMCDKYKELDIPHDAYTKLVCWAHNQCMLEEIIITALMGNK